jgi:hypothetical protein
MFVRSRKNFIALATGAILTLSMPLTSMTPASADSALPAAVAGPAEASQAVALSGPFELAPQEFTLRIVGSSVDSAAASVYRWQIPAKRCDYRAHPEHVLAYQLVYPIRPVHTNQGCGCGAISFGWHPNAGSAASWRGALASHTRAVARCACRAHAVTAPSARHRRMHRVRPRQLAKCGCRLVVRAHRVHRAHVARCECRLVVAVHRAHRAKCGRQPLLRVHRAHRAHVARCECRLVVRVHRVARVHVARCGCRLVRHVNRVVRVHRARPHVVRSRCMRPLRSVVRHVRSTLRALHRVYRVAHVLPCRVRTLVVHHCRHAAAHTTLLSFPRTSWSSRSWGHRLGHAHHCGHWA